MTFEMKVTPELSKAIENLLRDAEDAPFVLYGKDKCGGMYPIANISKHPGCPDGWFDDIIAGRWAERKEMIDKAVAWLEQNANRYIYNAGTGDDFAPKMAGSMYEDFKKAMESGDNIRE